MKKIMLPLLTLILILVFSFSAAASTVSVATELANVRSHYTKKTELTLFEETLALASMGMLTGRTAHIPPEATDAEGLAKRILALTAQGTEEPTEAEIEALTKLQSEEGSFGPVEIHCMAMLALSSRKAIYNSARAFEWLIAQQGENGCFDGTIQATALAVTALSLSENSSEAVASAKAVKYLSDAEASDATELAWQIIGITDGGVDANTAGDRNLLENLLSYQNASDYSFYRSKNDTSSDPVATAMAVAALDAINEDSSLFQRLAKDGKLSFYDPADLRPLLIFAGVALALSIAFWIYVFLHKKSTKTLEETKTY